MAELWPSQAWGKAGSDGELSALRTTPKVTSAEEAPRR
jgi:hypothetical protein